MPTYTVRLTGPGALAPRFEQMLDVLPDAALEGSEDTPTATLWFDVRARSADSAIERAYLRVRGFTQSGAEVTFTVERSSRIEGRQSWWWRRRRH